MTAPALRQEPDRIPAGVFTSGDLRQESILGCDVVVVGSGAGGSTVAAELAEAGHDVIVLEEGRYYSTRDFTADSSAMIRQLYRGGGATMALGDPPVLYQEGSTVGGGVGCLTMLLVSVIASVVLTIVLNVLF